MQNGLYHEVVAEKTRRTNQIDYAVSLLSIQRSNPDVAFANNVESRVYTDVVVPPHPSTSKMIPPLRSFIRAVPEISGHY